MIDHDDAGEFVPSRLPIPELAYRRPDVYHEGMQSDVANTEDEDVDEEVVDPTTLPYKTYTKLGIWANRPGRSVPEAQAWARDKFGPDAKVFETARFWVAYRIT